MNFYCAPIIMQMGLGDEMGQLVPTDDLTKVDASPTKAFFVEIITRDIQLDQAIHDLVDNCIDGAKRLRPGVEDADYTGLRISLDISNTKFKIADNCGGIPLEIARKYAFKFGRAKEFQGTSHSVGQFGVGMKRALFKMGDFFRVSSVEPENSFKIEVDVPAWAADDRNWDFSIRDLTHSPNNIEATGTTIEVERLDHGVAQTFGLDLFIAKLRNDLKVVQQHPMRLGLQITVNGEVIIPALWQLKNGEGISSSVRRYEDRIDGKLMVTRLFAGVGESSRTHAGWYVFCNGRCILEADQDSTTGWDETSDQGVGIPKYHGQFARFRGYAFLDADEPSILPWNTTKTGLDLEADAYRILRGRMIDATRPVIDFFNALDAEKDFEENDKVLTKAVTKASSVALENLAQRQVFSYTPPPRKGTPLARMSYQKSREVTDELKEALGAKTDREVGEKSFDYAYENLVEDK